MQAPNAAPVAPAPTRKRPGSITRSLLRSPALLYRCRLGRLISDWKAGRGVRFGMLVLSTRGRRSGATCKTVLEYREAGGRFFFLAGWGLRSDWVLSLRRDPEVPIEVGRREIKGRAHVVVSDEDHESAFAAWRRWQPRLLRAFYRLFGFQVGETEAEQRQAMRRQTLVIVDPLRTRREVGH